jgi:hypothetical protein
MKTYLADKLNEKTGKGKREGIANGHGHEKRQERQGTSSTKST